MRDLLPDESLWEKERGAIEQESRRICRILNMFFTSNFWPPFSKARLMNTARSARARRSTKPPAPTAKIPQRMVCAEQRHSRHRRQRGPAKRFGTSEERFLAKFRQCKFPAPGI